MNEIGNNKQDSFFMSDFGKQELFNGFKKNNERQERNDDLEILKKSNILNDLKELRDTGYLKWSVIKGKNLPTTIKIRDGVNLQFLKPEDEKDIDYEPARIYVSEEKNNVFVSILFDDSKELQSDGTFLIKCSETKFGIRDGKLCSLGFGASYKPLNGDSDFWKAIEKPDHKIIN